MPRVNSLDPTHKTMRKIEAYIRGEMRDRGIDQKEMADDLGMCQQNFSYKLIHGKFTVKELYKIFQKFNTSTEERGELMS